MTAIFPDIFDFGLDVDLSVTFAGIMSIEVGGVKGKMTGGLEMTATAIPMVRRVY